ncbi:hypothetical protein LFAB_11115 [Lactiplantibacillus fabifermentans T30PCM01]|uniref:Uncharacterized protein n=2 Tax=Lactiplantibacillus fabifermentans TaxID=483011 RepID=A0A0R2NTX5_9LACO|nr:hypothetical protein [Lactiplantibacillus fabifermentans]ETY73670.1 hypothetical protein LFAB_11115 [Lactiplantibacillus fabifermentans T30PCM01]KRO29121.1 hypothetical protein DY78_GL001444 [Lactiplantibacillus fabifermentans DSM 21115]
MAPKKTAYQVFYQLNDGDWTKFTSSDIDETQTSNTLDLGTLLKLTGANSDQLTATKVVKGVTDPTSLSATSQTISATLARENTLKVVVTPTATTAGTALTSANIADHLSDYSVTTVAVSEDGTEAAEIPTAFDLTTSAGSTILTARPTVNLTNDWQVPLSLTLGIGDLSSTLADGVLPLTTSDLLHYTVTVGDDTLSHQLDATTMTILPNTSPPTTSTSLSFKMTVDPTDYPAQVQVGKQYGIPMDWQLNYDLKMTQ